MFYQILNSRVKRVEYLIGEAGNAFAATGNVAEDLLSITAVHPMREEAVKEFLARSHADESIIKQLLAQDLLFEAEYEHKKFYLRRFPELNIKRIKL